MSELFDKSIRTLELPAVLRMLADQTNSAEAREKALAIVPETDIDFVKRLQDETDAARAMIGVKGSPAFSGIKPVGESLYRADRGGALNTRELLDIAGVLRCARRVREYFSEGEPTAIDHFFYALRGNHYLEERITTAILDEDEIADNASPELADIRRHKRNAAAKGRQILQKIISSQSYSKVLQETIITQRDGRFVVPVKAEFRSSLPGLVHDVSSSGATLSSPASKFFNKTDYHFYLGYGAEKAGRNPLKFQPKPPPFRNIFFHPIRIVVEKVLPIAHMVRKNGRGQGTALDAQIRNNGEGHRQRTSPKTGHIIDNRYFFLVIMRH